MGKIFTLDSLREELDNKYAPFQIEVGGEVLVMRNLLRLPEKERGAAMDALTAADKESQEEESAESIAKLEESLRTVISLVTADGKGQKLVDAIGDDLALKIEIVQAWGAATQPGEAENSPS
jgi:hypothetical protein